MNTAKDCVKVTHEKGLHARPASKLVQTAAKFDSKIQIRKDGHDANAKSSISVISLGVEPGDEIQIIAEGEDKNEAVIRLIELVEANFELDDR